MFANIMDHVWILRKLRRKVPSVQNQQSPERNWTELSLSLNITPTVGLNTNQSPRRRKSHLRQFPESQ